MAECNFDRKEPFAKIHAALLPHEGIESMFDMKGGGTRNSPWGVRVAGCG
jgi:hypothetical protein